jgi:hypothetical protein
MHVWVGLWDLFGIIIWTGPNLLKLTLVGFFDKRSGFALSGIVFERFAVIIGLHTTTGFYKIRLWYNHVWFCVCTKMKDIWLFLSLSCRVGSLRQHYRWPNFACSNIWSTHARIRTRAEPLSNKTHVCRTDDVINHTDGHPWIARSVHGGKAGWDTPTPAIYKRS